MIGWFTSVDNYIELSSIIQERKRGGVVHGFFLCYAQGERNHGDGHTLQKIWNSLDVLADEWEVEYVNTLHMLEEIDFDLVEDLRDWRHIDVSGNQKMTSWLGKKLASQYQIPDRRNEEALQYWNRDYEEFCQYREKLLEEAYK